MLVPAGTGPCREDELGTPTLHALRFSPGLIRLRPTCLQSELPHRPRSPVGRPECPGWRTTGPLSCWRSIGLHPKEIEPFHPCAPRDLDPEEPPLGNNCLDVLGVNIVHTQGMVQASPPAHSTERAQAHFLESARGMKGEGFLAHACSARRRGRSCFP